MRVFFLHKSGNRISSEDHTHYYYEIAIVISNHKHKIKNTFNSRPAPKKNKSNFLLFLFQCGTLENPNLNFANMDGLINPF